MCNIIQPGYIHSKNIDIVSIKIWKCKLNEFSSMALDMLLDICLLALTSQPLEAETSVIFIVSGRASHRFEWRPGFPNLEEDP